MCGAGADSSTGSAEERAIAREPCQHLACWTARADRQGAATGTCGPGAPQSPGDHPLPHPPTDQPHSFATAGRPAIPRQRAAASASSRVRRAS